MKIHILYKLQIPLKNLPGSANLQEVNGSPLKPGGQLHTATWFLGYKNKLKIIEFQKLSPLNLFQF